MTAGAPPFDDLRLERGVAGPEEVAAVRAALAALTAPTPAWSDRRRTSWGSDRSGRLGATSIRGQP